MNPTSFNEENTVLGKPPSMTADECEAITAWCGKTADGKNVVVTCWKITQQELDLLMRTGRIWIVVHGVSIQPMSVDVESPFTELPKENAETDLPDQQVGDDGGDDGGDDKEESNAWEPEEKWNTGSGYADPP